MSHDAKHIITDLEDAIAGVVGVFQTVLSGVVASADVVLAFKDERSDAANVRTFPRVAVQLYDWRPSNSRRHGGVNKSFTYDAGTGLAEVTLLPVPVDLMFQIDAYALSHESAWAIMQKLLPMSDVINQTKVTTTAGREFYLRLDGGRSLDDIETDNWFRTAWRSRVEIWFASPTTPSGDAYVVLQRKLTMLSQTWTMDPSP